MTNRFVVDALTQCTMQLGNNFVKEKKFKILLDFIVFFSIESMSQYGGVPYHLNIHRKTKLIFNII